MRLVYFLGFLSWFQRGLLHLGQANTCVLRGVQVWPQRLQVKGSGSFISVILAASFCGLLGLGAEPCITGAVAPSLCVYSIRLSAKLKCVFSPRTMWSRTPMSSNWQAFLMSSV